MIRSLSFGLSLAVMVLVGGPPARGAAPQSAQEEAVRRQSAILETRFALEKAVAREAARFGLGEVPRPPHWTGFRLAPLYIEFWQDKPFRLHDRLVFRRETLDSTFTTERLYP